MRNFIGSLQRVDEDKKRRSSVCVEGDGESVESKRLYKMRKEDGMETQYKPVYSLELCGVFCLVEKRYFLLCLHWIYYLLVQLANRMQLSQFDVSGLSAAVLLKFVLTRMCVYESSL